MLATEWDWDECIKVERQEGYEDGFELGIMRGKAEGRAEGVVYGEKKKQEEMIRKFSKKLSPEDIAETLHVAKEYVLDVLKEDGAMMVCETIHPYNNGKNE